VYTKYHHTHMYSNLTELLKEIESIGFYLKLHKFFTISLLTIFNFWKGNNIAVNFYCKKNSSFAKIAFIYEKPYMGILFSSR
jgi:hypothetical protein